MSRSALPVRKVGAAGLGGAVSTALIWALGHFAGLELGEEVTAAVVTLVTFAVGYLVPDRQPASDDAGAPEGARLRSPVWAGVAAVAVAFLLAGCTWLTARVDDATGTTLTQRCAFYAGVIDGIEAARAADGFITSDQAVRLALYRGLLDQYCLQVEIDGAALLPES